MTNNSEEKEEQQKRRLYIIHFDGCYHTRVVDAQYVRDAVHKIAGEFFYICEKCETDKLRRAANITDLPYILLLLLLLQQQYISHTSFLISSHISLSIRAKFKGETFYQTNWRIRHWHCEQFCLTFTKSELNDLRSANL